MDDLEGKTVVISGVGTGLGRRTALAAVREGANVIIGARTQSTLEEVGAEVDPEGKRVGWRVTDIDDHASSEGLIQLAIDRFERLDALVNCAAYQPVGGLRQAGDFSDWRLTLETNVIGTMRLTQLALPHLEASKGSVVFVSSQSQWMPPPEALQIAYAASKGAIWGAMHHLALEIGPSQVRVNEVAPGWMWGPPVQEYVRSMAEQAGTTEAAASSGIIRDIPLGRMASDGDVAEAIVFLASDRARGITGQTLFVNAGEYMH